MSALAEALLAAQRQAIGSLSKAFVADKITAEVLAEQLDLIGLRDDVDQGLLIDSLLAGRRARARRAGHARNG